MVNRRNRVGLVVAAGLALFTIALIAACGPSTYGQGTGTPGTAGTPGTLPETGSQRTQSPMTATQESTGTQLASTPGPTTETESITGTAPPVSATGILTPRIGTPGSLPARVEVVLKDYRIEMLTTLPSGLTVFRVTNAGMDQHSLVIEGPGFDAPLLRTLQAGETAEISVTLTAGSYLLYCPVDGHRDLGMEKTVTVTQGEN